MPLGGDYPYPSIQYDTRTTQLLGRNTMKLLENKTGLIVGATSGIGRAAALLCAEEGAQLAVVGRRTERLDALCKEIAKKGGNSISITADVTQAEDIERIVAETVNHFGSIDLAFNNAGTLGNFAPMLEQSEADWDNTITTNLKSVWLSIRCQAKAMLKTGGAIVNTSSWLGLGSLPGSSSYSASKAGIDGMIRAAAIELAEYGIRVNNINPGGIDTEMCRKAFEQDPQALDDFAAAHPFRRLGTDHEVAEVAAFLLSDRASNVTGQSIVVDGGYAIPGQRR
jgi:NAD(P)-dependent dehydrogenase (short-subunit alcohol dehydrogenase family)